MNMIQLIKSYIDKILGHVACLTGEELAEAQRKLAAHEQLVEGISARQNEQIVAYRRYTAANGGSSGSRLYQTAR